MKWLEVKLVVSWIFFIGVAGASIIMLVKSGQSVRPYDERAYLIGATILGWLVFRAFADMIGETKKQMKDKTWEEDIKAKIKATHQESVKK